MKKLFFALVLAGCAASAALPAHAQEATDTQKIYLEKSVVLSVVSTTTEVEPWSGLSSPAQSLTIQVLEGPEKGKTVTIENDFTQLKVGDLFYSRHAVGGFDLETWSVSDPYRLNVLIGVALAFLVLLFLFGGIQGLRGLASLVGSFVLIFYLLVPSIYTGHSPILVSVGVSSLIIIAGSYITHGFNRTTTAAMLGMILTIIVVGTATYVVIHLAHLSGFTTEQNAYLTINTQGRIDMIGLLFGGIMVGLLGVLYDIAIGQAITVEELLVAGTHYTRKQVFARAMRVGREHIGALVNTLAIAYVGVSLPLLLLFQQPTDTSIAYILNSEIFATEILRILMSSIGLILAVPITTLIATRLLKPGTAHTSVHSHAH